MNQLIYTVFVEYRVEQEHWDKFIENIPLIRQKTQAAGRVISHLFLTGSEQPGLVVENIQVADWETYERIRAMRTCETDRPLSQLDLFIKGGRSKIHIWAFKPISEQSQL
ncbi:hypothetical protein ACFO25_19350 [Paenactinomyces guangxiensis]|uniref:ABM domain-containing protein n=1 Tax=Paenactinomyces guangxiensis TaxID=1490290 RepID=A0A7W2AA14_9BACL|nr:hypothetical protein [Paenactinomyces guangxiensis]MBA4495468.1 hypothetical protein [Paenactinomyces guangxiensis]MBH8592409.1 hypothetical protein [Paenactinomyces guangxiensis]